MRIYTGVLIINSKVKIICIDLKVKSQDSNLFLYNQRRSSDIRDLQSKSKKSTNNKQYKDYFKRLIENNPSHIDS